MILYSEKTSQFVYNKSIIFINTDSDDLKTPVVMYYFSIYSTSKIQQKNTQNREQKSKI